METQPAEAPATPAPGLTSTAQPNLGHRWKPGQSGNPAGPMPKGQGLKAELERELNRPYEGRKSKGRRVAEVLVSKALGGETEAIRMVYDRMLGRPAQALELSMEVAPLAFFLVPPGQAPTVIEAQSTEAEADGEPLPGP